MKIMKITIYEFFLICLKILSVYCITDSVDCTNISNFFSKYNYNAMEICCKDDRIVCSNGNIVQIYLEFAGETLMDFSEFPILQNLKQLTLLGNVFKDNTLPSKFFDLPSLETLKIEKSSIRQIPNALNNQSPIKKIFLGNNYITEFPYQLQNLKNLDYLYLNNNLLQGSMTNAILNFPSLRVLNIEGNDMVGPLYISTNLNYIYLNDNQFDSIVITDSNKYALKEFHAYGNMFDSEVIEKLSHFPEMIKLTLGNNKKITTISPSINKLTKLQKIDLSILGVRTYPNEIFDLDLVFLNISYNPLLDTEIYNFKTKIDNCVFDETKIKCYEPNTCANIDDSIYNKCGPRPKSSTSTNTRDNDSKGLNIKDIMIIVLIVLLLLVIGYLVYRRINKNKKNDKNMNDNSNEKSPELNGTKSIVVTVMNGNKENKNINNSDNQFIDSLPSSKANEDHSNVVPANLVLNNTNHVNVVPANMILNNMELDKNGKDADISNLNKAFDYKNNNDELVRLNATQNNENISNENSNNNNNNNLTNNPVLLNVNNINSIPLYTNNGNPVIIQYSPVSSVTPVSQVTPVTQLPYQYVISNSSNVNYISENYNSSDSPPSYNEIMESSVSPNDNHSNVSNDYEHSRKRI